MPTLEIMQRLVQIHNRIIQVSVSGESTIIIADTIRDIRQLLQTLESDVKNEQAESASGDDV